MHNAEILGDAGISHTDSDDYYPLDAGWNYGQFFLQDYTCQFVDLTRLDSVSPSRHSIRANLQPGDYSYKIKLKGVSSEDVEFGFSSSECINMNDEGEINLCNDEFLIDDSIARCLALVSNDPWTKK